MSDDYAVRLRRVAPADVKKLELSPLDDATMAAAAQIVRDVREGGEAALLALAQKFGDIKPGAEAEGGPDRAAACG
jgi:histidinol dehydrogenase